MLRDLLVKRSADNSEKSLELQKEICIGHKDLGVMNEPITNKARFHGKPWGCRQWALSSVKP